MYVKGFMYNFDIYIMTDVFTFSEQNVIYKYVP